MDNNNELREFDLDEIMREFHDPDSDEIPAQSPSADPALTEGSTVRFEPLSDHPAGTAPAAAEAEPVTDDTIQIGAALDDTVRIDLSLSEEAAVGADAEISLSEEDLQTPPAEEQPPVAEPAFDVEEEFIPPPIVFTPRSRLKELKKKLVAGPEKRYYELSEAGTSRLQLAVLLGAVLVLLGAGVTALFVTGMVPANRLRLVIFSQVLILLISGLLGSHLMVDSLADLLKGRFSANTLLTLTFAACCVDAVFCLKDLRVPCCSAFALEMTFALAARLQRRNTEIAQMDTMRKAVRLHGIKKDYEYYEGDPGLLRTEGEVEDFMETYDRISGPELVQSIYAFLSLLACIAISVLAGLLHGIPMAVQILSTSLLVAVPASFFICVTRPMAILEKRLHMVGTVLCGWQGVRQLCGKAVFPLDDQDLFPQGSTKLNGVKFYGDRNPDETVSFSASVISAAGGDLVPVFKQLLAGRNGILHKVENFQNYGSGGIGGEVCGEPVLLGTLNFLQDMGVDIPEGTMVSQAVYAAIDGQLCAVYAISYAKMRSAAAGLVTLCGCRKLIPMMLCGDFMLTEDFIRAKFNVKTRRILFPSRDVRDQLKAVQPHPDEPVLALTTREELVSAAYAVSGARALRRATKLGVTVHLIAGILGMLIMAALAFLGSTDLLIPTNILLYQLIWAIPGLLITEWTRVV